MSWCFRQHEGVKSTIRRKKSRNIKRSKKRGNLSKEESSLSKMLGAMELSVLRCLMKKAAQKRVNFTNLTVIKLAGLNREVINEETVSNLTFNLCYV